VKGFAISFLVDFTMFRSVVSVRLETCICKITTRRPKIPYLIVVRRIIKPRINYIRVRDAEDSSVTLLAKRIVS